MIVLGLILVLLAGAAIYVVAMEPDTSYTVFGYTFQPSHLEMFLTGAVTAGVLLLGISLLASGSRRSAARRRKLREVRHQADDRVAKLEDEKRQLERKLHEDDSAAPATDTVPRQATHTDDHLVAGRPSEERSRHKA
ncbi:hypothetical protein [Nonomuraea africana]|uniref:LapA family protein n=1 Tax=Nonomuraea africana TaxID=46171 RepID=A0ABR9KRW0_9ACTN|nr:hypothetical protein [Nonomuraea africana]MBE1564767.1 hypothetical protein [Nonomuraea africana]